MDDEVITKMYKNKLNLGKTREEIEENLLYNIDNVLSLQENIMQTATAGSYYINKSNGVPLPDDITKDEFFNNFLSKKAIGFTKVII